MVHWWLLFKGDNGKYCASAATAKSLQSCPTLWPHRRQPTRLPRPWDSPGKSTGVRCHFLLQWMKMKLLSRVWLLATPWTAAYQAPPPMGFSRQEYWSGVPLPSPNIVLGMLNSFWGNIFTDRYFSPTSWIICSYMSLYQYLFIPIVNILLE